MRACLFDLDVYSPGLRRSSPPNGKRCSTVFCGNAAGTPSCPSIMSPTSVTAGMIFHRIRTPLSTWFAAIWFLTSQKNGMSALGLQRVLGFGTYETAWAWLQKLRRAMVRPDRDLLSGVVELDEVFVGNESRGRAGGVKDNTAVMVAVDSLPSRKLGRVRLHFRQDRQILQPGRVRDERRRGRIDHQDRRRHEPQAPRRARLSAPTVVGIDSPEPA